MVSDELKEACTLWSCQGLGVIQTFRGMSTWKYDDRRHHRAS
jgi:hypothetical protein